LVFCALNLLKIFLEKPLVDAIDPTTKINNAKQEYAPLLVYDRGYNPKWLRKQAEYKPPSILLRDQDYGCHPKDSYTNLSNIVH